MITDNRLFLGNLMGNYRLEELVEQRPYGPLFLARHQSTKVAYLLRLLTVDTPNIPADQAAFLDRFQQLAAQLQTFRHPYIMPVLDAGQQQGIPYLVYPHVPIRTVTTRLEQNGPPDVATIGRYLDQLAAALEYAHEHAITHGALSTDSIYLQLDGRLIVTDFGVQRILESGHSGAFARQAARLADSAAPEQLLGQPTRILTDVYAMGAVLYRLLTGYPVYAGHSPAEIASQTLNAPIPLLSTRRPDLPPELDDVLAHALAKIPEYRYHRPGVLANAYHRVVTPQLASRIPFVESDPQPVLPPTQIAPRQTPDVFGNSDIFKSGINFPSSTVASPPPPPPPTYLFAPALPAREPLRVNRMRAIMGMVLALIILVGGTFALVQNHFAAIATATGAVHFFDVPGGHSNGLRITVAGLTAPPAGMQYQAWMIDAANERILALGMLLASGHSYTLTYQNADPTINLLGAGNQIEITQEHGQSQTPLGKELLTGFFPPKTFVHIQHLMLTFPTTPGKIGLLVGLAGQTTLLSAQAHQLQADHNQNPTLTQCLILNMLTIIEGSQSVHAQSLSTLCQQNAMVGGDGFGLLPPNLAQGYLGSWYLAVASDHATLTLQQPDVTAPIRTHAQRIIITLNTIKGEATTLDADLLTLLKNPTDTTQIATVVTLADAMNGGATPNTTDPAQAGAQFAYAEGQLMADLPLTAITH